MTSKAPEVVEAAITGEAKLDAHTLRTDFPIFQQRVHGEPVGCINTISRKSSDPAT
jgi:hypothetical protein